MLNQANSLLNNVLIDMSRSFLQYVAESWPWVQSDAESVEQQVMMIAERQRQDVADIAALLNRREHFIDMGSFPTQYTDLQFLALESLFDGVNNSQASVLTSLQNAIGSLRELGDDEAVVLLTAVLTHQQESAEALKSLQRQLADSASA